MATYILKGMDMSNIVFSSENHRLLRLARSIANGVEPAKDARLSTRHWHAWKAGDSRAINRYIKENVMLFYCEALKLKAKFFDLDLDEVFSLILEYTHTAFQNYDPSNTAELVSYHCRFAQYYVSNTAKKRLGQDYNKIKVYKAALKLRERTQLDLRECLIQTIKSRRSVRVGTHESVVRLAESLLHIFKGHTSLNEKLGYDRDSDERIDLLSSGVPDTEIEIERKAANYQISRIKRLLKEGLSDEDQRVFDLALKGLNLHGISLELNMPLQTVHYRRGRVMKKVKAKAKELKAKGIRLPAIF